jgi:hypothetical protein
MTNISYEEELKNIWVDNLIATKSHVLEDDGKSYSILICAENNHDCNGYSIVGLTKHKCPCLCHIRSQFIADTMPPVPLLEFQTAKELLVRRLHTSKNKSIETKYVTIHLHKNDNLQFAKKG